MVKVRSRLLLLSKHRLLAEKLSVELVMTPYEEFVKVDSGALIQEAKDLMEQGSFDQLPVEADGKIIGLIRYENIKGIDDQNCIQEYVDREVPRVREGNSLGKLINSLQTDPCVFVVRNSKTTGLVHRSDLNKQALRTYFYLWLAAAEIGLAEKVKANYKLEEEWIDFIGEQSQVIIMGRLAIASKRGMDIHPVEYADFSDLVNVVTKDKGKKIWSELGFDEREWKTNTGNLVELRHKIMHPVRTLVAKNIDVRKLAECNDFMTRLVSSLLS